MYAFIAECQVITPMFMAGADGRTPELRPSEFKGMMRFWWRATKAEDNIEKLKEEENKIFGGTGEKEGKSKIKIAVKENINRNDIFQYQPLPHHSAKNCEFCRGRCNKSFSLPSIKPEASFKLLLEIRENYVKIEENNYIDLIKLIKNLLFIEFTLGGFGKRARRGFGSVIIKDINEEINLKLICNVLNQINNIYRIQGNKIISLKKDRIGLPYIKEVLIGKDFPDYDSVLKAIGEASHNHKDPSLGCGNPRMASPIYVSAIRDNGKYRPVITILNSKFPYNYPKCNFNFQRKFIEELTK